MRRPGDSAGRELETAAPRGDHPRVSDRCAALVGLLAVMSVVGCSLFHHGAPPQQRFLDALSRGNGMEADQIWLQMDPRDRANLSHSIGITPHFSKDDLQAAMLKHQQEKAEKAADQDSGATGGEIEEGDINSQMIEMPGLDADTKSGSLLDLPKLAPSQQPEAAPSEPEMQH